MKIKISDLLFGKPLASSDERAEHIGALAGIPIFGLDALSSAAYGPEAALTLLIPLGLMGVHYIVPVIAAIILLLTIVFFSYRQTIDSYPHGGGSYTVASENLGEGAGLLAAAALMIDYVLTAAVGISAGVGALISGVPSLQPHTLGLCLGILAILVLVNLRGVRDTGVAFMVPTYLFIVAMLAVIAIGVGKVLISHGHPVPVIAPPSLPAMSAAVSIWLILKVFASGCTAMTGVEAVSNGVMAFRPPTNGNAKKCLTVIIALLIAMLGGIAYLCKAYNIGATNPNGAGYQSVLSELFSAVTGRGWFYYGSIASIVLVLALSANTAFADFPRLTRAIAENDFLPHVFRVRGRRLLYSHGVWALTALTAILLIAFGGVTDRLIPLYAIGAFMAFTLSQAGMVMHWKKQQHAGSGWHMFVNGTGAVATGITTLVVLVAKFVDGAWVTVLLVVSMIALMIMVKRHYKRIAQEMEYNSPLHLGHLQQPMVVIPMAKWSRLTEKALRFALVISKDIQVAHVACEQQPEGLAHLWEEMVLGPARKAGLPLPELVTLESPYRLVVMPLIAHVLELSKKHPGRKIVVIVPELVVKHWWENALHNQRSQLLKVLLELKGNQRIVVVNMPWYL